jgi:hypothetical protein
MVAFQSRISVGMMSFSHMEINYSFSAEFLFGQLFKKELKKKLCTLVWSPIAIAGPRTARDVQWHSGPAVAPATGR